MTDPQQPPGPEELQQALANAMFGIVMEMAPPGTTEKQVADALDYATQIEMTDDFAATFHMLFDEEKVAARPRWGVQLHPENAPGEPPHLFHGPKRLEGYRTPPGDLASFLLAFGLFNSPVVRAVCALHGYRVQFVEVASKAPGPNILLRS